MSQYLYLSLVYLDTFYIILQENGIINYHTVSGCPFINTNTVSSPGLDTSLLVIQLRSQFLLTSAFNVIILTQKTFLFTFSKQCNQSVLFSLHGLLWTQTSSFSFDSLLVTNNNSRYFNVPFIFHSLHLTTEIIYNVPSLLYSSSSLNYTFGDKAAA